MTKFYIALLALVTSATVFAEPIIYICERPAWEGKEGCGPNNTYYTYGFFVDTDNFDHNTDKDSFRYRRPEYVFAGRKGCDLNGARGLEGQFTVTDDGINFWFPLNSTGRGPFALVKLNTISMEATMKGVRHSTDLACEEVKGEAIKAHPRLGDFGPWPSSHWMTMPASAVKNTHTVR